MAVTVVVAHIVARAQASTDQQLTPPAPCWLLLQSRPLECVKAVDWVASVAVLSFMGFLSRFRDFRPSERYQKGIEGQRGIFSSIEKFV